MSNLHQRMQSRFLTLVHGGSSCTLEQYALYDERTSLGITVNANGIWRDWTLPALIGGQNVLCLALCRSKGKVMNRSAIGMETGACVLSPIRNSGSPLCPRGLFELFR